MTSIWPMVRRVMCLLCFGFLVSLAMQQSMTNIQEQGATTVTSYSSSPPPLPLEKNFQVPKLKGRKIGPKNSDTFKGSKRKVPNGPDPIHNRRAGKSGERPGRQ